MASDVYQNKDGYQNIYEYCDGCGLMFTKDEWEDRHSPHTHDGIDNCRIQFGGCQCDYQTHEQCCWECNNDRTRPIDLGSEGPGFP